MLKRIFKNVAHLSGNAIINKLLFFVLLVYITKNYDIEFVGVYTFIFAITELIFIRLGYKDLIVRTITKDKSKTSVIFGNIILIESFLILIRFLILGIYLILVPLPPEFKSAILITSIGGVIGTYSYITWMVFESHQEMRYALVQGVPGYTFTVFLGIFFLNMGAGIVGLATAFLIGSLISFIINAYIIITRFCLPEFNFNKSFVKWLLKEGWPFMANSFFANFARKTDVVILQVFTNFTIVGIFVAASKIMTVIWIIPSAFLVSVYPQFSFLFNKSIKSLQLLYKKSLIYLVMFGIFVFIGTFFFAKFILLTVYSTEFLEAVTILKILTIITLFLAISKINFCLLNAMHKQHTVAYLTVYFGTTNIILDILLVQIYGVYGLLYSSIVVLIMLILVQRRIIKTLF